MPPTLQKPARDEELAVSLPVKIEAYSREGTVWRDMSRLETVSRTNAEFYLTRSLEIGQMVLLKMPIKKELRRHDHEKENYSVWGIVRECRPARQNEEMSYHVRIAFTGQQPPDSFRRNPLTVYKLGKLGENGFWQISEAHQGPDNRRQPRYQIPIEINIAVYDEQNNIVAVEDTVTENISKGGASVFSDLPLTAGDKVVVTRQNGNFSAEAVVRHRRVGKDNLPRLHLEFVNISFPLEGIE